MLRAFTLFFAAALLFGAPDGPFSGTWESTQSGTSGTIRIRLKPEAEVVFTLNGQEVKTKVASVKTSDAGFEIDYDFTLEGYDLRSSAKATVTGADVRGEYRTTVRADGTAVDAGRFQAKAAE